MKKIADLSKKFNVCNIWIVNSDIGVVKYFNTEPLTGYILVKRIDATKKLVKRLQECINNMEQLIDNHN